jgi:sugar fermentation stimulation protein A
VLVEGRLIRRYKRFLADIQLGEGVITAACPNTGSMMGCCEAGSRVWLSESDSATRKYRHTWEIVEVGR